MAIQRWKFGSYEFTYNPYSDSRSKKATSGEQATLSGTVTNTNPYYDNSINFVIDLYDKPTYYEKSAIKTTAANYYSAIAEKRVSGELYCLRSGAVDVIRKDGTLARTASHSFSGTPVAIAHLDDRLAIFFASGSLGYLYITDESCNQISKYTVTDTDYINCSSIAWNYGSNLYVMCKFGKIFKTDYSNGTTTLIKQMDDYDFNKANSLGAYRGIHFYKDFCGFIKKQTLTYLDAGFNVVYGNELPATTLGYNISIIYGSFTGDFTVLTANKIIKIYPNVCGVDIELIRAEMKNGIVLITDEKNRAFYTVMQDMTVDRKRNKQDARYSITLSGKII
ncbi:hypothetical protein [Paenibacillus illinoisensis]|uniref:hypothetical protein n=1 Tax=Paenibacillus illinoisensis TaxID=59845 RepID=UPI00301897C2